MGLEDEQVNQDLEGEGVGSGKRRKGELWNEQVYGWVPFPRNSFPRGAFPRSSFPRRPLRRRSPQRAALRRSALWRTAP